MSKIYLITENGGRHSRNVSAWTSKEVAEINAKKMNAGQRWGGDFNVEELNIESPLTQNSGYEESLKATYDFGKHGLIVDSANIAFEDVLIDDASSFIRRCEIVVFGQDREECISTLIQKLAEGELRTKSWGLKTP